MYPVSLLVPQQFETNTHGSVYRRRGGLHRFPTAVAARAFVSGEILS
jgi:hypothetical protein